MKEKRNSIRTRNFATIVYEESSPKDWKEILNNCFVPTLISPYHDKDKNTDGTQKKPHWHILIMFDNVKTIKQAQDIFDKIGGVGCEIINSVKGYARYLCHLDNPEKAQYNTNEIIEICGANYINSTTLSTDKYKEIREMIEFCEKYKVYSFYLLSKYAFKNNENWTRILCDSGTIYMREYLKSKDWSKKNKHNNIIDSETGELII